MKKIFSVTLLISLTLSIFLYTAYSIQNIKTYNNGEEWNRKYGIGEIFDIKADEENYICVGITWKPADPWNTDIKVIKIDEEGNEIWNRTYQTETRDYPKSVEVSEDGYVILSESVATNGLCDYWVFKIDKKGNIVWSKKFSGSKESDDIPVYMTKVKDGFLLIGWSNFTDVKNKDIWLIKLDDNGNEIWNKTYGVRNYTEHGEYIVETQDGYLLFGTTDFYTKYGDFDIWIIKIDKEGNEIWNKSTGTAGFDSDARVVEIEDGYMLAGNTDLLPYSAFLIKLDKDANEIWKKRYGGYGYTGVRSLIKTIDGYLVAGNTEYRDVGYFDGWLLKVDKNGNKVWEKKFGGRELDHLNVVLPAKDGYLLGGEIGIYDPNYFISYSWIIKCQDYPPPEIEIVRPKKNCLYIFDREVMPFPITLAIGDLTVIATSDNPNMIKKVEFYLTGFFIGYDYKPRAVVYSPPYEWKFNLSIVPVPLRPIEIMCVAYYGNAGAVETDGVNIYILNLLPAPSSASFHK